MASGQETYKYHAFISYSHRDSGWADWLHRAIETYTGHRRLADSVGRREEPLPDRLFPVFRDREELEGVADLPERINLALSQARCLIVICSPHAVASRWVGSEIQHYKSRYPHRKVLALIVGGTPGSHDDQECFPPALLLKFDAHGRLTDQPHEPGAADARKGKDGRSKALLKILAAMLDVDFDQLRQRDQERRRRRLAWIAIALGALSVVLAGLASVAWYQREEAVKAQRRADENAAEARHQQSIAQERARDARARQLAAMARNELPGGEGDEFDLSRGLLYAVQAIRIKTLPAANAALLELLQSTRRSKRFLWGHTGDVNAAEFAADGRFLISAGEDGRLLTWDTSGGALVDAVELASPIMALAIDKQIQQVAIAPVTGPVLLRNLVDESESTHRIDTGSHIVSGLSFNAAGHSLLVAGAGGVVTEWDLTRGVGEKQWMSEQGEAIEDIAISSDGRFLAAAGPQARLTLWDRRQSPAARYELDGHTQGIVAGVYSLSFNADGSLMASAGSHGDLLVWDLAELPPKNQRLPGHDSAVLHVQFRPDGGELASVDKHGLIRLQGDREEEVIQAQGAEIRTFAYAPNGETFATGGRHGRLILWSKNTGSTLGKHYLGNLGHVGDLVLSADGSLLTVVGEATAVWRSTDARAPIVSPRWMSVRAAEISGDNEFLVLVTYYKTLVYRLNALKGEPSAEIRLTNPELVKLGPYGRTLTTVTGYRLDQWRISDGDRVLSHQLIADAERNRARNLKIAALSPDHSLLAWSDRPGRLVITDIASGKPVATTDMEAQAGLLQLAFSPDGSNLVSRDQMGVTVLWLWDGKSLIPISHWENTRSVTPAFSHDSRILAMTAGDRLAGSEKVILRESGTGQQIGGALNTGSAINRLTFSPDGNLLAAGGRGKILIWDLQSRQSMGELLLGNDKAVTGLSFSPDSNTLYSVAGDVVAWNLTQEYLIEAACKMANRNLSAEEWYAAMGEEAQLQPVCTELPALDQHFRRVREQIRGIDTE